MEKGLKFALMLSLKEIALKRVAVLLSSDYVFPCSDGYFWSYDDWLRLINTHANHVKYKISKILLPESLKKEMMDKVLHISLEIKKWAEKHEWVLNSTGEIDIPAKLFWTSAGTINHKKTAEAFLGCEALDVEKRYKLACDHCSEDYIPLLWEKLAEDRKEFYLRNPRHLPYLQFCWPRILKAEFSDLDRLWRGSDRNLTSFNQWAFEDSAERGNNKTAAEYFFLKLTHEEREVSVMRTTLNVLSDYDYGFGYLIHYDVLCYLLSLMTPEQQIETIKEHPVDLLCFFMIFWEDLPVENYGLVWPFLPTSGYGELSERILEIAKAFPPSFLEFFTMSPLEYKKYFVHEHGEYGTYAYRFLDNLRIYEEYSDSIECLFRNVVAADRAAIIFNPNVLHLLVCWQEDRRRMVEVCLREAKLCKEDRERLGKKRPDLRRVIEELYESDATAESERKGQKHKLESSEE